MTAEVETAKVRSSKTTRSRNSRNTRSSLPQTKDARESVTHKPRTRSQRRVAPESATMQTDKYSSPQERRRSSKGSKRNLTVDTNVNASTPRTAASTPSTPVPLRGDSDLRSPGQRKSPVAKIDPKSVPIPDFITQTDEYGNASTPRTATAVEKARVEHPTGKFPNLHVTKDGKLSEESEDHVDACTETLLDSFRIMCCCLVADDEEHETASEKDENELEAAPPQKIRLLPAIHPDDNGKKCLVLDLDETLVHSSFRAVPGADFVIPVQIEDVVHFVYVIKRPGVDEFLVEMAKHYEIVVYTASLNKYADPLLDLLDPHETIRTRLFRESCVYYEGNYVKDLSLLDRDLSQAIIVDNSPSSYIFHPENAIDCSSFIDDPADRELDQIAAFLKGVKDKEDVRGICHEWRDWPQDQ